MCTLTTQELCIGLGALQLSILASSSDWHPKIQCFDATSRLLLADVTAI